MNRCLLAFILLLLPRATTLEASDSVQFPTGLAAWTVDVSDSTKSGPSAKSGVSVVKVDVTQGHKFRCSKVSFSNGQTRASWDIPGSIIIIMEDSKGNPYVTYPSVFYTIPFLPSVFDWVSPSLLQEQKPVSYGGKECFHYKGPKAEAWIDSKTLLPVALDNGSEIATYTFLPPPATPPILPNKFQSKLDFYYMSQGVPQPHR